MSSEESEIIEPEMVAGNPETRAVKSESALSDLLSSAGFMHPSELERVAIKCGNGLWCRHWYHWGQSDKPWIMAIQIRSFSGSPVGCDDLKKYGFVRYDDCLYLINRANEDGTPYRE